MCAMKYPTWEEFMGDWEEFIKGSFGDRPMFPTLAPETPTFMGLPEAKTPEDLKGVDAAIIGAPYVATTHDTYAGVDRNEWLSAPKRVRQQSARYQSGYIQEFRMDVFDHLKVVDYGDAPIPAEVMRDQSPENILKAQAAVEMKVGHVLDAGAIPVVIGQNSPCGSYAIAKPIAERTDGAVGCVSLDTHWDIQPIDFLSQDPRIAGSASWKHKMYEFHENMHPQHLVEIGERGMLERKDLVESYTDRGSAVHLLMGDPRRARHEGRCPRAGSSLQRHESRVRALRHGRDGRRGPRARRHPRRGCGAHWPIRLRDHQDSP